MLLLAQDSTQEGKHVLRYLNSKERKETERNKKDAEERKEGRKEGRNVTIRNEGEATALEEGRDKRKHDGKLWQAKDCCNCDLDFRRETDGDRTVRTTTARSRRKKERNTDGEKSRNLIALRRSSTERIG
jgi:hypothetical protein